MHLCIFGILFYLPFFARYHSIIYLCAEIKKKGISYEKIFIFTCVYLGWISHLCTSICKLGGRSYANRQVRSYCGFWRPSPFANAASSSFYRWAHLIYSICAVRCDIRDSWRQWLRGLYHLCCRLHSLRLITNDPLWWLPDPTHRRILVFLWVDSSVKQLGANEGGIMCDYPNLNIYNHETINKSILLFCGLDNIRICQRKHSRKDCH